MRAWGIGVGLGLAAVLALASALPAQAQVVVKTTTTESGGRQFEVVAPGPPRDVSRPHEADFYRDDIRVRHEPAFFEPLSKTTPTGLVRKVGLSGWTAPPGPGEGLLAREASGWFALGITFIWE
jgi:hypothetical protein